MTAPEVLITLTGQPRWRIGGAEGALARLDAALLALLLLAPEQPRDRVAAWLWPSSPLRAGNVALRQRVFQLRQRLGHPLVQASAVLRRADGVVSDLELELDAEGGELLGGLDFGDLEAFDAWLGGQRAALERRRVDLLAAHTARLEARGALAEAIQCAERLVARSPELEHGWRRLMRLHHLRGDRAAAVAAFERYETTVCRELGLRPSPETQELLSTIERAQVPAGTVRGPLPAGLIRPPRLVGRSGDRARIDAAWAAGRAVLVLGEGGIGKSRLLEDALATCEGALMHRARPGDAGMPYATAGGLLAAVHERFAPPLTDAQRSELARLLPAFGAAPAGPAHTQAVWHAVEALLAAAAGNGLAAVGLDDLHLADDASLELLHWLLASDRLAALRWCLSSRPHEDRSAAVLRWLGGSQRIEPLPLAALSLQDVHDLAASLGLAQPPTQQLAQRLHRHAGGQPFFTLETLKELLLTGAALDAPHWPLPRAAQAVIARRVERLPDDARSLLRLLALSPLPLRLEVASQVLGRPLLALVQAWSTLDAAQLIQDRALAHDLVRESVLAGLPAAARPALHRALAQQLQHEPDCAPIVLAEHWWAAEAWAEAIGPLRAAADRARRAGRLQEEEQLLDRAADAAARVHDDAAAFDARCGALQARMLRLGATEVLPHLDALAQPRTAAGSAGTGAQRSRLAALRCEALLNLARVDEALDSGEQALREAAPGSSEAFQASLLHGRALGLAGRADEAVRRLEGLLAASPQAGDPTRHQQALEALAHARYQANRHVEALQAMLQAVALAEPQGDATALAHLRTNVGVTAAHVGDTPLAYRAALEADRAFAAMGLRSTYSQTNAVNLARHAAHLGRLDQAVQAIGQVLDEDPARTGASVHAVAQAVHLSLRLWLGEAEAIDAAHRRLQSVDVDAVLPSIAATVLLARLRWAGHHAAPVQPLREQLLALGVRHPELLEVPMLLREWVVWDPTPALLQRVLELAARRQRAGAPIAARSLRLAACEALATRDPAAAAALARPLRRTLAQGLLASVYPPQAWGLVGTVLRRDGDARGSAHCLKQARAWIDAAVLPDGSPATRQAFERGNPVNRRLLTGS